MFFFSYLSGKAEEQSVRRSARKQATRAFQMEPNEVRKCLEHENFGLQVCVKVIND